MLVFVITGNIKLTSADFCSKLKLNFTLVILHDLHRRVHSDSRPHPTVWSVTDHDDKMTAESFIRSTRQTLAMRQ